MIESISAEELTEITMLIKTRYGYDFSSYAEASLKRRLLRFLSLAKVNFFELKYQVTNDKPFFFWLLETLTVNVTEMFRDPHFYKNMKEAVFPVLSTYPIIKIWHAGCASGEEAFSMAIMLKEAGLLDRSKIYATDISMTSINRASCGIIPISAMKSYTTNYQHAGGIADFADYYTAMYDNAIISKDIRKHIVFSQHNLVTDYVFNEFQLICCRNVLIYFNRQLQGRVFDLFYKSLSPLGYLALGIKESMLFAECRNKFDEINLLNKIYRRKS